MREASNMWLIVEVKHGIRAREPVGVGVGYEGHGKL